jgi:hypothetical protein
MPKYLFQITRGSLQPANNLNEEWKRMRTGENFFIQYKLQFPAYKTYSSTPPLPTVKSIIVNDVVLCSGDAPREYAEFMYAVYVYVSICEIYT